MDKKDNPIHYIYLGNKIGMRIGNLTIYTKTKDNKLRNLLCSEFNIKCLVFGKRGEKKKSKGNSDMISLFLL